MAVEDPAHCSGACEYAGAELCLLFGRARMMDQKKGLYWRLPDCEKGGKLLAEAMEIREGVQASSKKSTRKKRK